MPKLNFAKAANASFKPSYIPIAVFVGGTSGVGEAMVKALSSYTSGRVHLVIIGRNRAAAAKTFSSLPRPTDGDGQPVLRDFVYCDAYLMKNITAACQELSEKLPKINFLVLSAGYFRPTGRVETEEGLDQMLVMRYYNRFKYTKELLPLLQKAKAAGEQAGMMSILGAGAVNITSIDTDDLDMKKKYGTMKAAGKSIGYNDIMVEEFAKLDPEIAFTHIYPGSVDTPGISEIFTWWPMYFLAPFIYLNLYLFGVSAEDAAEYMLFALLDGKKGWYRRDNHGNDI
ncbi:NAD(P)-binding protein, partial [Hymenopellis radicata]